jgi:hypothetical protein
MIFLTNAARRAQKLPGEQEKRRTEKTADRKNGGAVSSSRFAGGRAA